MKVWDINPFIRFAKSISYKSDISQVNVFDSRIFCVVEGNAEIIIDGAQFTLSAGSVFYCAGGSRYCIFSGGCIIDILNFDLTQSRRNIKNVIAPYKITTNEIKYTPEATFDDGGALNSYIYIKDGDQYITKIKDIINEFRGAEPFFMEKCSAILKELLIDIYRNESIIKSPALKTVDKVRSYIDLNLDKKISNSQIASFVGYHEYHLNRLFLNNTGKTVHQYIIDMRIKKAKHLLITTDFSLGEIALSCGFNGSAHLCASFKAQAGMPPSQYRESKRPSVI